VMLPTAVLSTGKRLVPTDPILIAFSWLGDKSTLASDGTALDEEPAIGGGLVCAGWPDPVLRSTVAKIMVAAVATTVVVFLLSCMGLFIVH